MKKKQIFLVFLTLTTAIVVISLMNIFQVPVFASEFVKMINILNDESLINSTIKNGLIFARYIILIFISINILLILILALLFNQFKIKKSESLKDPLCKIYNKRFLENLKLKKINFQEYSAMMIDIDYFKQYNDNYGHLQGDKIIYMISQLLLSNCRESDLLIRYGGEEFCILLPNTNIDNCLLIAENILRSTNELNIKHEFSEISTNLTVSIGIAVNTNIKDNNIDYLLNIADTELYNAKSNGRNQYSYR